MVITIHIGHIFTQRVDISYANISLGLRLPCQYLLPDHGLRHVPLWFDRKQSCNRKHFCPQEITGVKQRIRRKSRDSRFLRCRCRRRLYPYWHLHKRYGIRWSTSIV